MKSWKAKPATGALTLLFVVCAGLGTLLATDAVASKTDRDPPVVIAQRVEAVNTGEPLLVGAQIVDPSGIGDVVLWVRGEQEKEFRQIPMKQVGEDQVQAKIKPWPEQGSVVAYYIEARDAKGNGPSFAGAPRTPYIIRLKGAVTAPDEAQTNWVLWIVTAAILIVLVGGYFLYRQTARNRLNAELHAELNRLAGIDKETGAAATAPARDPVPTKPRDQVPQSAAEQEFWIGLLLPLCEMGSYDREHALQTTVARAHHHPTLGKRFFDMGTLNRHLEWVERRDGQVDEELFARHQ